MPIVLYLTTDCNLNCEYCYEANNREQLNKILELDIISVKQQMEESYKEENRQGNCIVLFGGEPFLKFDLMKEIFELNKKFFNCYYCFAITTNGTLITEEILNEIKEYSKIMTISIGISYDGIGTYRRKYPNGESAESLILDKINLLENTDTPFGISYTIHKANCQMNSVIKDIVTMFEKYKNLNKIELSYYTAEIEDTVGNAQTYMIKLMDKLATVYRIYEKPICCAKLRTENNGHDSSAVCKLCKRCTVIDDRIYVTKNGIIKKGKYENDKGFSQWTNE